MKKLILLGFITCTTLVACQKKSDVKEDPPKNYEEIKFKHINARENTMSGTIIPISGTSGLFLKPGDVIIFKTDKGHLGKMRVNNITINTQQYVLNISAAVYPIILLTLVGNADNVAPIAQTNSLDVALDKHLCDLDGLVAAQGFADPAVRHDFFIARNGNGSPTGDFMPVNGAKFAKYVF
jgi:hypothetical protein